MSLIKILTQMFEQFLPTLVCVVPISFAIGTIVGTPLVRLINKLYPASRENREGAKEQFLYDWLELLVGAFLCGFLTFPIAERISGGALTLWESVGVAICLLIFALLTPIMAAKTIEGKDERTTRNKLISFWAGLAGGGLLGAFVTL